jgi:Ca2+-binding RTX toxin-like protein
MAPHRYRALLTPALVVAAAAALTTSLGPVPAASGGVPTCLGHAVTVDLGLGQHPTGQDDVILGTNGDDVIFGFRGNDTICGGGGFDVIQGGGGDDTIDGGTGADIVSYNSSPKGVTVSLADLGPQDTGSATGTDTLSGFDALTGSAFDDTLTGDDNGNFIRARRGDDTVDGGPGQDPITGRLGQDFCDGGADAEWARGCDTMVSDP